jgi:hypothetical protein
MSLNLPPELEAKLREGAASEGLSIEAYVERLVWMEEATSDSLADLAVEGIDSGDPIEVNSEFWEERRQQLQDRRNRMSG